MCSFEKLWEWRPSHVGWDDSFATPNTTTATTTTKSSISTISLGHASSTATLPSLSLFLFFYLYRTEFIVLSLNSNGKNVAIKSSATQDASVQLVVFCFFHSFRLFLPLEILWFCFSICFLLHYFFRSFHWTNETRAIWFLGNEFECTLHWKQIRIQLKRCCCSGFFLTHFRTQHSTPKIHSAKSEKFPGNWTLRQKKTI